MHTLSSGLQSEDGGGKVLQNTGVLPQLYMVSQPKKP